MAEVLSHKHWSCKTEVVAIAEVFVAVGVVVLGTVVELKDEFEKYVSFA